MAKRNIRNVIYIIATVGNLMFYCDLLLGTVGVIGNLFTLIILCSSSSIRNKTFNMFLISQSALDFMSALLLIVTAWQVPYGGGGGHFGIKGELYIDFIFSMVV